MNRPFQGINRPPETTPSFALSFLQQITWILVQAKRQGFSQSHAHIEIGSTHHVHGHEIHAQDEKYLNGPYAIIFKYIRYERASLLKEHPPRIPFGHSWGVSSPLKGRPLATKRKYCQQKTNKAGIRPQLARRIVVKLAQFIIDLRLIKIKKDVCAVFDANIDKKLGHRLRRK
jgi:hypothetical protein